MGIKIPVEVSARHCHLSQKDLEKLFGVECQLGELKELSQPGLFACKETITIKNNSCVLKNVRIIGPERQETQIEISKTDAIFLGIEAPLRISGDIDGSPGVTLIGPEGEVVLEKGVIIAKRHIHCSPEEAKKLLLKDGDVVSVKVEGERGVVFNNVKIRTGKNYCLRLHLDTDEGNAAGINKEIEGELII